MKKIFYSIILFVLVGMSVAVGVSGEVAISVTTDGVVPYGRMAVSTTINTYTLGDIQTVKNTGDLPEKFRIKGRDSANWTLENAIGTNQYVHGFCVYTAAGDCDNNPGPNDYIPLSTEYTVLSDNVNSQSEVSFHLQITTPDINTTTTEQQVNVTILAEAK